MKSAVRIYLNMPCPDHRTMPDIYAATVRKDDSADEMACNSAVDSLHPVMSLRYRLIAGFIFRLTRFGGIHG